MKLKTTIAVTLIMLNTVAQATASAQTAQPMALGPTGSIFKVLNPAKYEHDQQVIKRREQKRQAEQEAKRQAELKARQEAIEAARLALIAKQQAEATAAIAADYAGTAGRIQPAWTIPNGYAALNCTAYVASRVAVPGQLGNANMWGYGLLAAGWRTGGPRRGAVGVQTAGWAGHVVLSESVNADGSVHISEYNHIPYSYSDRDVSASAFTWYYP